MGRRYILVVLLRMDFFSSKLKKKKIDIVSDEQRAVVTSSLNPRKMSLCCK